jgi:hypothetical protein
MSLLRIYAPLADVPQHCPWVLIDSVSATLVRAKPP